MINRGAVILFTFCFFLSCKNTKVSIQDLKQNRITLPNGWHLTPFAEKSLALGDLPLQMTVSPSQRYVAITNNGVGKQFIQLFDAKKQQEISQIEVEKAWYGLAFNQAETQLFASGGNDNKILIFDIIKGQLRSSGEIKLGEPWSKEKICPTGLVLDENNNHLFCVTKEDNALYSCNLEKRKVEKKIDLGSEAYSIVFNPLMQELYISLWGAKKVAVFDSQNLMRKQDIMVGENPNELLIDFNTKRLFVANALDNSVSIVDLTSKKIEETLNSALYPDAPNGSTTNSLALSADAKILFVANADNNNLAVFDISEKGESRSKGFIPTGWYPTSVRTIDNKVYVVNAKGYNSAPNPKGPQPTMKDKDERAAQYIGALFLGQLSIFKTPNEKQLAHLSKLAYENSKYQKSKELETEGETNNPIPQKVGATSPIKYVFYIIKENRTYDQVLGDLPQGNGDSSICLFPRKITPNHHAIAENFVLLDNFYVDAEVSADGHNWSMAAYANDFVEKTWPTSYGGRGGNYDYEGTRSVAFPKSGFIWDNCKKHNVSYRTYGEFADDYKANYSTIEGHFCPNYSAWDLNIQDIAREKVWEKDFDSLLNINQLARFNTIRFGNDHTSGMAKGAYSPAAAVADNDLAFGCMLAHLSKSKIWKESVVFVLEDDAQNGPDHVDAHRSIAFVAGPYVKRKFVDHTQYSTSSMLRTMELILGLPPMSQFDAGATPMWRCFTATPDFSPYLALQNQIDIDERNIADNQLSKQSATFNLAKLDAVPELEFNQVLWKAIKGEHIEMPAPRRAAFVTVNKEEKED